MACINCQPLLYTITQTFLHFRTLPMHTCAKDRQTAEANDTYYFHSNVYFLTVDIAQNAIVMGTWVPALARTGAGGITANISM